MAITPRTIFTNPASATLTVASLFAMTATGMYAFTMCERASKCAYTKPAMVQHAPAPCESVRQAFGYDSSTWSERAWFRYATCFDKLHDSRRAISVANEGIKHYPRSEALYNLKGYHLITLKKYTDAVRTLEEGIRRVGVTSNGTMANNLAWAGMWTPREMSRARARDLYMLSLRYEPNVCETLHTGLWVEYAMAKEHKGLERVEALRNFNKLKAKYMLCTDRDMNGKRDSMIEVLGAAVAIEDLEQELNAQVVHPYRHANHNSLMMRVSKELRKHYQGTSIDTLCRESIPVAIAHHTCVRMIDRGVTKLRTNTIVFR